MNIKTSTAQYEKWLFEHVPLEAADLHLKHLLMTKNVFTFLRGTYYHWARVWKNECPELAEGIPVVLSVGDLHMENFGTWRDLEGRLIWGINDFDEAYPLPFTNDLVRLCTSVFLAIEEDHLAITHKDASKVILKGYYNGLVSGGNPFVLGEHHTWLRKIAIARLKTPSRFWKKITEEEWTDQIPSELVKTMQDSFPSKTTDIKTTKRTAGVGSLGKQRFVVFGKNNGGYLCRQAKALSPSAASWVDDIKQHHIYYSDIIQKAIRCPDPYMTIKDTWLIRRLSPDCSKINLVDFPKKRNEKKLLYDMGFETANVHLGSKEKTNQIIQTLVTMPDNWLDKAARTMTKTMRDDWTKWKKGYREVK